MQMFSKDGCVLTCTATQCSYNQTEECHAPKIQVGDEEPMCDTYTTASVSPTNSEASVQTCNVTDCNFNDDRDCNARGITVGIHAGHADCVTFRPQMS